MAKKYLLYIHDSRFDKEVKKSELVNSLLETHYKDDWPELPKSDLVNGKAYARGHAAYEASIIKTKKEAIMSVPRENWEPCKHGANPNLCKFKKPGKPCK